MDHNALPLEIMMEIEPRCNFNCPFCFNKNSFAKKNRFAEISSETAKKIIDGVAELKIERIRFTGGEPLLNPDLLNLARYAKQKKIKVLLNTNGSLLNSGNAGEFADVFDKILIPLHSACEKDESEMTHFKGAFKKKINAIKLLNSAGSKAIAVGTIISSRIAMNFEQIFKLVEDLPVASWFFFRPIGKSLKKLSPQTLSYLIKKIEYFSKRTEKKLSIANAFPFCAVKDMAMAARVSQGAFYDEQQRLAVDPRGFLKPHYFIDKNLGMGWQIRKAWDHPFIKKIRNFGYLPKECRLCAYKEKCRGGSRFAAKIDSGRWNAPDPLAISAKER
jgi:radical SAM protein with 4Fe4S-binding SPASM domain